MSLTLASPSCESLSRDTASYSYSPCCALVVDLMCHSSKGIDSERAISAASSVLPVPGSPLIKSGRDSTIAAFTAAINSSVAMYRSVPRNSVCMVPAPLLACDLEDLHGIGASGDARELALGENDEVVLLHEIQIQELLEYGEVERLPVFVRDVVGDRIDAAIEGDPAARRLLPRERIDRNVRAYPRHPQRRLSGLRERDDGLNVQMVGGIHHRRRDRLVCALEVVGIALADSHMRAL